MSSALAPDAPRWRRHTHADGYGYAWLLVLILAGIAFQLAAPDREWARVVTIALQGATLLATLRVARAPRWLQRTAIAITVVALLVTTGALVGTGALGEGGGRAVALMLVLLAPAAIALGVLRQARAAGAITVPTMFGVLCVYLLIGPAFAFGFGIVAALEHDTFFASGVDGTQSDFLYFSFTTLTTTGYGDLTAATDLGHALSITEALIGQIYLVTVVALIVANLGGRPAASR